MYEMLILALLAGMGLGGFFFGGLWWTVHKGISSKRPGLLFLASLVVRTSLVLTGFYFVGAEHWQRLLACLLGFVLARLIVTRLTNAAPKGNRHDTGVPPCV